jgi:hypothetical protein
MKKFYAIILGFTAILLAVTAAYFSVFGLSKLFIGAATSIIIMAGTLEFSKIIVVSYLHQYWDKIAKKIKVYLLIAIAVLMIITSAGIYGFLTNAYSKVSTELDKMGGNIELLDKRIEIKKEEKNRLDEQLKTKSDRVISLTNLRKSQETRLDSLYQRGWMAAAKKTEVIISQADDNITSVNKEIDAIGKKIEILNDSIAKYETSKLEIDNSNIASEVGPLKYIAKLTGTEMDTIVNWLTLLLIIVFDPMAVALVISTSAMIKLIREEKQNEKNKSRSDYFKKKVQYVSDEQGNFKLQDENIGINKSSLKNKVLKKWKDIFNKIPFTKKPTVDENAIKKEFVENDIIKENITKEENAISDNNPIKKDTIEKENVVNKEFTEENSFIKRDSIEKESTEKDVIKEYIENETKNTIEEFKNEIPIFSVNQNTVVPSVFTATTSQNETGERIEENIAEEVEKLTIENVGQKQSLYLKLLEIFYDNGNKKKGDEIPSYSVLIKMIDKRIINVNEKDVKDFLLICNLLKITEFKENLGIFEKDYKNAKMLISSI